MDLGLRDKIALVTGAGSGIGQAIALSLADEGARLVATDVRQETAAATAAAATACGIEALGVPLDVTNYGQAQAVVQQAVQHFGQWISWSIVRVPGGSICLWILSLKTGPLK